MRKLLMTLMIICVAVWASSADITKPDQAELTTQGGSETKILKSYTPSGSSTRDLLFDQSATGYNSYYACQWDSVYPFWAKIADNFYVPYDATVDSVVWWGGYWNGTPTPPVDFWIEVYPDSSNGQPMQDPVYSERVPYSEQDVGGYYMYEATIPGFSAVTTEQYWINFQPTLVYPPQWGNNGSWPANSPGWGDGQQCFFKSEFFGYPQWVGASTVWTDPIESSFQIHGSSGSIQHDVGTQSVVAPPAMIGPNSVHSPEAVFRNYGQNQETFDVYFMIDSAGTNLYSATDNITVDAGNTQNVVFTPDWTCGPNAFTYDITAYTVLSGDENPGNDTLNTTTTVSLWSSWEPYNPPGAIDDRLTHATIYDNDNDRIYMIGGTPDGSTGSNVPYCYAYDPASDTWNTGLTSMPTARGWLQGGYWDQRLYVFCGYSNSSSALTNTEIYDVGSDTWSTGAPCPEARLAHGTVVYNGNAYCVGGVNAGLSAGLTTVYRYDCANDTWTLTTNPLPYEFDMGGVTIWDNVIYIVNGYQRSSSAYWTHVYEGVINPSDPDDITWNQLDPLPVANIIINGATAMMGNVYQLGGFNINDFWEYEPGTGTWTQLDDYPIPSIARNHFVIARRGSGEIYGVAGDANSDWGTPNNYYYKIYIYGAEEQTEPAEAISTNFTVSPTIGSRTANVAYSLSKPSNVTITMFNSLGQKVQTLYQGNATTHSFNISLSELPNGIYFLDLQADGASATQKLVVTK